MKAIIRCLLGTAGLLALGCGGVASTPLDGVGGTTEPGSGGSTAVGSGGSTTSSSSSGGTSSSAATGGSGTGGASAGGSTGGTSTSAGGSTSGTSGASGTSAVSGAPTFSQVYAILDAHCSGGACHNPGSQRGFSLSSLAVGFSSSSRYVSAGNANGSTLYLLVSEGLMPPRGPLLSSADLATIAGWINAGAPND